MTRNQPDPANDRDWPWKPLPPYPSTQPDDMPVPTPYPTPWPQQGRMALRLHTTLSRFVMGSLL